MRDLLWSGGYNIRDLGGLPTVDGGVTVSGRIVRSAMPDRLTERGWASLVGHGVRTIIDLRDEGEDPEPVMPRPDTVALVPVPIDTIAGQEWYRSVRRLDGTPRIFTRYLEDRPETVVALVEAVAGAEPGGIVVHCSGGRDRTGLASLVLLALAGVEPGAIAEDYALSYERQRVAFTAMGNDRMLADLDLIDRMLAEAGVTAQEAMLAVLEGCDIRETLSAAGATAAEIDAVTARLRES
jgi:protein-tyrosine phosphatase